MQAPRFLHGFRNQLNGSSKMTFSLEKKEDILIGSGTPEHVASLQLYCSEIRQARPLCVEMVNKMKVLSRPKEKISPDL